MSVPCSRLIAPGLTAAYRDETSDGHEASGFAMGESAPPAPVPSLGDALRLLADSGSGDPAA